MNRLNIGCGRDYRDGWWNCDISQNCKSDATLDIATQQIPFSGGTVDEVYISGVLEQIAGNEGLIHAMNECYRVLKPGGVMTVVVPNARYAIAHRDPMDVRKFTREMFEYFRSGTREFKLYGSVYGFCGWTDITVTENHRHIFTVTFVK